MQIFVLGWLVLELSDSASQLDLVTSLFGVPNLTFMMLGGVLADRWDRRLFLLVSLGLTVGIIFILSILTV